MGGITARQTHAIRGVASSDRYRAEIPGRTLAFERASRRHTRWIVNFELLCGQVGMPGQTALKTNEIFLKTSFRHRLILQNVRVPNPDEFHHCVAEFFERECQTF